MGWTVKRKKQKTQWLGSLTLLLKRKKGFQLKFKLPSIKSHKNYSEKNKETSKDNTFETIKKAKRKDNNKIKVKKKKVLPEHSFFLPLAPKVKAIFRLNLWVSIQKSNPSSRSRCLARNKFCARNIAERIKSTKKKKKTNGIWSLSEKTFPLCKIFSVYIYNEYFIHFS